MPPPWGLYRHDCGWRKRVRAGQRVYCRLFSNTRGLPGNLWAPWILLQNVTLYLALCTWYALGQGYCGPSGFCHLVQADPEPTYTTPPSWKIHFCSGCPPKKRLVRAGGSALITHTHTHTHTHIHTQPVLDLALSRGPVFSSFLPSSSVYATKINRTWSQKRGGGRSMTPFCIKEFFEGDLRVLSWGADYMTIYFWKLVEMYTRKSKFYFM